MDQSELLPGVLSMLHYLKKKNRLLWDQPAKNKTYSGENGNQTLF
jgi:hypothetical protein